MRDLLVFATVFLAAIAAAPQASSDETSIRNIIQEEMVAWNAGDATAYARHFDLHGTCTSIRGEFFIGRQAFIQRHDYLLRGPFRGSTLKQDIVSLRFVRPDVAVVEVLTLVTGIQTQSAGGNPDNKGSLRTRLLQVLVNDGGDWRIVAYHNTEVKSSDAPVPDPR
jgi:uncharacterized protein (TIGR02246 family)